MERVLSKKCEEEEGKKKKRRGEGLCVGKYAAADAAVLDNSFSFSFRLNLSSSSGSG